MSRAEHKEWPMRPAVVKTVTRTRDPSEDYFNGLGIFLNTYSNQSVDQDSSEVTLGRTQMMTEIQIPKISKIFFE